MTTAQAKAFISSVRWQQSKDKSHEYTVLAWNYANREMFVKIAKYIAQFGYKEKFWSKEYTYMQIGNYIYWTMDPLEATDLVNRKIANL